MNLNTLRAEPSRYQVRELPWSVDTVAAIVGEGIDLAKFDKIPVVDSLAAGFSIPGYVVAGDGHSRFEAINRLASIGRLPEAWRIPTAHGDEWDIPCKEVSPAEALHLARTANLSRKSLTPCEEARVFQEMLDAGYHIEKVATLCHKSSASYIRKMLPLNGLARDIRIMIGVNPDAGGIDKHIAQTLAERFAYYGIGVQIQQELWQKAMKHADLTVRFVRTFIDKIGISLQARSKTEDGFLFEIPPQVSSVIQDMKGRADNQRRVQRGLAWLLQVQREGPDVLADFPELDTVLRANGAKWLGKAKEMTESDATVLSALCVGA